MTGSQRGKPLKDRNFISRIKCQHFLNIIGGTGGVLA